MRPTPPERLHRPTNPAQPVETHPLTSVGCDPVNHTVPIRLHMGQDHFRRRCRGAWPV